MKEIIMYDICWIHKKTKVICRNYIGIWLKQYFTSCLFLKKTFLQTPVLYVGVLIIIYLGHWIFFSPKMFAQCSASTTKCTSTMTSAHPQLSLTPHVLDYDSTLRIFIWLFIWQLSPDNVTSLMQTMQWKGPRNPEVLCVFLAGVYVNLYILVDLCSLYFVFNSLFSNHFMVVQIHTYT